MESTRLPGKTLAPILGRPMLSHLLERLSWSREVDEIVVATTDRPADSAIATLCANSSVACFRGSSEDVLDRVLRAGRAHEADAIVEITADCPLTDPEMVDEIANVYRDGAFDYVSNHLEPGYPLGFAVQVFSLAVLEEVARLTHDAYDREHVSLYIYSHPERYRLHNVAAAPSLRRPDLRLTVDTALDLQVVEQVFGLLAPTRPRFSYADIVELLDARPDLARINAHVHQKSARE